MRLNGDPYLGPWGSRGIDSDAALYEWIADLWAESLRQSELQLADTCTFRAVRALHYALIADHERSLLAAEGIAPEQAA